MAAITNASSFIFSGNSVNKQESQGSYVGDSNLTQRIGTISNGLVPQSESVTVILHTDEHNNSLNVQATEDRRAQLTNELLLFTSDEEHPEFVPLSSSVSVPEFRLIICESSSTTNIANQATIPRDLSNSDSDSDKIHISHPIAAEGALIDKEIQELNEILRLYEQKFQDGYFTFVTEKMINDLELEYKKFFNKKREGSLRELEIKENDLKAIEISIFSHIDHLLEDVRTINFFLIARKELEQRFATLESNIGKKVLRKKDESDQLIFDCGMFKQKWQNYNLFYYVKKEHLELESIDAKIGLIQNLEKLNKENQAAVLSRSAKACKCSKKVAVGVVVIGVVAAISVFCLDYFKQISVGI